MIASEIPQPDRLIQATREKGFIGWVHGHGDDPFVMAAEVSDVFVFSEGHIPDDVILLGAGMYSMSFVLSEMYQVHPILFAVQNSLLSALFTIVYNDLVICTRSDDALAIVTVMNVGYLFRVVLIQLGHPHTADDIVHKLHPDGEAAKSARADLTADGGAGRGGVGVAKTGHVAIQEVRRRQIEPYTRVGVP